MTSHPRPLTVSSKELVVLQLLADAGELYGLQLVDASRVALKRGTIYVTLGRLETQGYITSPLEGAPPQAGGLPRRLYTMTALGRRMSSIWSSGVKRLVPEFGR